MNVKDVSRKLDMMAGLARVMYVGITRMGEDCMLYNVAPPLPPRMLKVHKIENFFGSDFEFSLVSD